MGAQLTKNYDVEKEHHMTGGLNSQWKIYRGRKKGNNSEVSIFVFEKKLVDKKYPQTAKDEIFLMVKKEGLNLAKYRHPHLLNLIESPLEDAKAIVFVTEPVEYNLASLVYDQGKRECTPGELEFKCLALELLEALNFLHNTAKTFHMNISPENVYVNNEGRLKLAGFNFPIQFTSPEPLSIRLSEMKVGPHHLVPNLKVCCSRTHRTKQGFHLLRHLFSRLHSLPDGSSFKAEEPVCD